MKTKQLNGQYNIIGSNIKKYRKMREPSQRELANKVTLLGVTLFNSDISRIENNTLFIRDFELKAISKVLNISVSQLFEDTDQYFDYNNY